MFPQHIPLSAIYSSEMHYITVSLTNVFSQSLTHVIGFDSKRGDMLEV